MLNLAFDKEDGTFRKSFKYHLPHLNYSNACLMIGLTSIAVATCHNNQLVMTN